MRATTLAKAAMLCLAGLTLGLGGWPDARAAPPPELLTPHLGSPAAVDRRMTYQCGRRHIVLVITELTARSISITAYGDPQAAEGDLKAWNAALAGMTEIWHVGLICNGQLEVVTIEGYGFNPNHAARRMSAVAYWGHGKLGRVETHADWEKAF